MGLVILAVIYTTIFVDTHMEFREKKGGMRRKYRRKNRGNM